MERFLSLSGEGGPMSATAEKNFAITRVDQLEPGATLRGPADGRQRFDVRRHLGITAFGIQAFSARSGGRVISEHTETLLGEEGQQELYIVVSGAATFEIDGESVEAPTGALVHIEPIAKRTATATEDGTTILVVGGTPGEAYKPAPERREKLSPPTTPATTRPLWRSSASPSRSSRTTRSHTSTPGASRHERDMPTRRSSISRGRSRSTSASGSSWPATRTSSPFARIPASPSWRSPSPRRRGRALRRRLRAARPSGTARARSGGTAPGCP